MRRFLIAGVLLGVVVVAFAACSDAGSDDETAALQLQADRYDIGRIEEQFHQAMTLKDIDQMMSLWAPNATLTVGPDLTASGVEVAKAEVRLPNGTIRQVGEYDVALHLHTDVEATVKVVVVAA